MPTITPFLWFDDNLEEAIEFYRSVFPDAVVSRTDRLDPEVVPGPSNVMVADFELCGQKFTGLNGGPGHPFTDAISLSVEVEDQAEIDRYWDALTADGGQAIACGWLKDRFGLSWQIVPRSMSDYVGGPDAAGSRRATEAMLTMVKLDLAALKAAYES